ncbi:MAG: bifunctional folylpolyglutamate synthase/dihydrofolate synthase [Kiritimatiellia bacterium]
MTFLEELAVRRRFGMKPGLAAIRAVCAALGNPERRLRSVLHVAGTNGKGAVCAILDACLRAAGHTVGRYTSPHLIRLNERFFLDGAPLSDAALETASARIAGVLARSDEPALRELTFFEALTAVGFVAYAAADPDFTVLETGLGGRLDATNVCTPALAVITRIGRDHCDWLGDTVEAIAEEKAGIVKPEVPVVLGRNVESVVRIVRARAAELHASFHYAPDLVSPEEIPADFSLAGGFNRENAVTACAALKVLGARAGLDREHIRRGLAHVVWPGRFHRVGKYLVDGAHNPPAARALAAALGDAGFGPAGPTGAPDRRLTLICGFCGDKDVNETLRILKPFVARAFAVKTANPRALNPEELAGRLAAVGIPAEPCAALSEALARADDPDGRTILICGSLFLAGEALVALKAYPWPADRLDAAELLRPPTNCR